MSQTFSFGFSSGVSSLRCDFFLCHVVGGRDWFFTLFDSFSLFSSPRFFSFFCTRLLRIFPLRFLLFFRSQKVAIENLVRCRLFWIARPSLPAVRFGFFGRFFFTRWIDWFLPHRHPSQDTMLFFPRFLSRPSCDLELWEFSHIVQTMFQTVS